MIIKMNAKDACSLLLNKMTGFEAVKCFEYESLFVFAIVPEGYKYSDNTFNTMWSVNKQTKQVQSFQPFHISVEEYRNGKEVTNFK